MAKFENTSENLKKIINEQVSTGHSQKVSVTLQNGENIKTNAQSLINYHLNNFHNWNCTGYGHEEIFINYDGNVFGGRCLVKQIGHASDSHLALLTNGIVCPRTICMCSTDVMLTKENTGKPQLTSKIDNR
jgi:hypothetical protein